MCTLSFYNIMNFMVWLYIFNLFPKYGSLNTFLAVALDGFMMIVHSCKQWRFAYWLVAGREGAVKGGKGNAL